MVGKPSVFDKQEWLNIPPTYESSSRHTKRRLYVLTKLPRLTALVRAVRKDPRDVDLVARATKLAEELLALDWGVSRFFFVPSTPMRVIVCTNANI